MIRNAIAVLILAPLALVIVALAVANRQVVTVSFDPFNPMQPALAVGLPLYLLVFLLVIAGVIIGGVAAWLRQSKWRRASRRRESDLRMAQLDIDILKQQLAQKEPAPPPTGRAVSSYAALRPPAA